MMEKPAWKEFLEKQIAETIRQDDEIIVGENCRCGAPRWSTLEDMEPDKPYCDGTYQYIRSSTWNGKPVPIPIFAFYSYCPADTEEKWQRKIDRAKSEYLTIEGKPMCFETFECDDKNWKEYEKAVAFAENPAQPNSGRAIFKNENPRRLIFVGEPGRGKTFLARSIYVKWLIDHKRCEWFSAPELAEVFRKAQSYNQNDERVDFERRLKRLHTAFAVFIDDLGTERKTESELFEEQLKHLLDKVQGYLIVTLNLNYQKLVEFYSEKIASRLVAGAEPVICEGEDYRRKSFGK